MNYKEKYERALNRAKKLYEQGTITESLGYVFPELKESEGERIRKAIIRILKGETGYTSKEDTDKYVAWLEKQGKRLDANDATKPHWISVEDELPPKQPNREQSKNVLVRTNSGRTKIEYYDYGNDVIKEWWEYNITHWMPMPAPPHHIIDANKKVDRVIGTADHIKTALDVLNKKGGEK